MLEDERIRTEPCGCRVDVVTGIRVYVCVVCAGKLAEPFTYWPRKDWLRSGK